MLLLIVGATACAPSSDGELRSHLRIELRGGWRAMYDDKVSFAIERSAVGASVRPGRRDIVLRANGRILPPPRVWAQRMVARRIPAGSSSTSFWHHRPAETAAWLGGPGSYRLTASLGPVTSNALVVEVGEDGAVRCDPPWQR